MTQKKMVQPQITHDHAGHAHVNCPGHAPCRLCRIEVDHLSVSAGNQQLLHDVNLHIHCGELTALIGANGAGKTTLIRALEWKYLESLECCCTYIFGAVFCCAK